ncbi:MAG: hypothetical protein FWC67_03280 [Defluviitaleaceae bacterium]|nr:hypothetical protein [Defluviitaleaceae bacterium]
MKKKFIQILSGVSVLVVLAAIIVFTPNHTTIVAEEYVPDLETQHANLQDFLASTTNPRTRTAFDDVFTGGTWGTPLETSGFDGLEEHFIIGLANYEDATCQERMQELREDISSSTGIPQETISFAWIDTKPTQPNVPMTLEQAVDENPEFAIEIIWIYFNNAGHFGLSDEYLKDIKNAERRLREKGYEFIGFLGGAVYTQPESLIEPFSFPPRIQMGTSDCYKTCSCKRYCFL